MPFPNAGDVNTSTKTGVKEYVFAKLDTLQNSNLTTSDHIKFDTVLSSRGSSVVLDTTTTYSNSNGAASIGRFSLKAGLTYKLYAQCPYLLGSGATGLADLQWNDVTGTPAALPGTVQSMLVATTATNDIGGGAAFAVFSPAVDSLVELRILTATALTQFGTAAREAFAIVETI